MEKISRLRDEIGSLRVQQRRDELSSGQVKHLERLERELDKKRRVGELRQDARPPV
jgi:hypothetical protein